MWLIASLLLSAQANSQPLPAKTAKADKPDKVVCRMEQEAHSRIPTRICRTQADWDRIAKYTQDDLNSSRNDRTIAPN